MALLRESSTISGEAVDLKAAINGEGDGGIAQGKLLADYAEAVHGGEDARIAALCDEIRASMGDAALVDAAAVAATFNAIDRIADSTGIPLEDDKAAATEDIRAELGINDFAPES